jgi:hypothetical protein
MSAPAASRGPASPPRELRRPVSGRSRVGRGVDAVGWLGSVVSLAALLVLAAAAGALADGVPAGGPTITATFDR